jgi:hypothetical protein
MGEAGNEGRSGLARGARVRGQRRQRRGSEMSQSSVEVDCEIPIEGEPTRDHCLFIAEGELWPDSRHNLRSPEGRDGVKNGKEEGGELSSIDNKEEMVVVWKRRA